MNCNQLVQFMYSYSNFVEELRNKIGYNFISIEKYNCFKQILITAIISQQTSEQIQEVYFKMSDEDRECWNAMLMFLCGHEYTCDYLSELTGFTIEDNPDPEYTIRGMAKYLKFDPLLSNTDSISFTLLPESKGILWE